jgi:dolichol-phosphate mannosyltransferase
LDGAKVLKVRMYEGAVQTWKEWGRSLDLKDASSTAQLWGDLWLLLSVQGLPLPIVLTYLFLSPQLPLPLPLSPEGAPSPLLPLLLLLGLNLFLLAIRFALLFAIAPSYDRTQATAGWLFWISPLADPLAVLRIFLSAFHTPTQWRGRSYGSQKE